jgi:hypothetical protein
MRVLVCGGRDYGNTAEERKALYAVLNSLDVTLLIEGGARGADALGKAWADYRGIKSHQFPANWELYGKAAGAVRNKQMLDVGKPDLVVACKGGRGTANMVSQASSAGVPVRHVILKGDI